MNNYNHAAVQENLIKTPRTSIPYCSSSNEMREANEVQASIMYENNNKLKYNHDILANQSPSGPVLYLYDVSSSVNQSAHTILLLLSVFSQYLDDTSKN